MIDALSPLFAGPMVAYRDLITTYTQVQADDEASLQRVVPARDVLSPGWLTACIAAHGMQYEASPANAASHHSAPDEQALLSQWSKYLLSSMVSLPLAANLLLDHQLPLEGAALPREEAAVQMRSRLGAARKQPRRRQGQLRRQRPAQQLSAAERRLYWKY